MSANDPKRTFVVEDRHNHFRMSVVRRCVQVSVTWLIHYTRHNKKARLSRGRAGDQEMIRLARL